MVDVREGQYLVLSERKVPGACFWGFQSFQACQVEDGCELEYCSTCEGHAGSTGVVTCDSDRDARFAEQDVDR